jgi:hypothetical protein
MRRERRARRAERETGQEGAGAEVDQRFDGAWVSEALESPSPCATRVGKQRGAKVAQVDLARRLSEAIWHMLTRDQPFAPAGATDPLAA